MKKMFFDMVQESRDVRKCFCSGLRMRFFFIKAASSDAELLHDAAVTAIRIKGRYCKSPKAFIYKGFSVLKGGYDR